MVFPGPVPTFRPGGAPTWCPTKLPFTSKCLFQVILAMPRHQQEQLTATVMDAFKRDFSG